MEAFVLGSSIFLQFIAAVLALRLIRVTGSSTAWIMIAMAVSLMAIRRSITFLNMMTSDIARPTDITAELVALSISVFMVVGIALIRPLFISMQRAQQKIIEREQNLSAMANNAGDGILVGVDGRHVFANEKIAHMLGYRVDELLNTSIKDVVEKSEYERVSSIYKECMQDNGSVSIYETRFIRKDGVTIPVELSAVKTVWYGQTAGMMTVRDISERQKSETQMLQLSKALEQTADSVVITNPDGVIEYVNPAFESTTGYTNAEVLGESTRIMSSGKHSGEFYNDLWETIKKGHSYRNVLINRKKDGSLYYEEKTITPLKDEEGAITHFISTGKDITDRMQTQERLHYLAYHDILTGLANRALFLERLTHALDRRGAGKPRLAVLYIDLDHFKTINDTLGHDHGDDLLQQFSERLKLNVRKGDTIARFGGDEFAILVEELSGEVLVSKLAEKILEMMDPPFMVGEHEFYVTTSIGISQYPDDSDDANTLIKYADVAMYRAKDTGRNNYQFYSEDLSTKAFIRLNLETALRHAMEREEFRVFYQPQVDIRTGRIIGAEALIRWQHPDKGLIAPDNFIPLLEESGMIVPVGKWVLQSACQHARKWQDFTEQPFRIAVNLSARQFYDPGLTTFIDNILVVSGLSPETLELEMTESVLMQNDRVSIQNLNALNDRGIRLSIDDFGTGYSSLSYLKRFPVDTLKVDRSFIRDVVIDEDDASIVSAIISMAQNLKLDVVAEGVETVEQLNFLRGCLCYHVQGFLFSKPVPVEEFDGLMKQKSDYISLCS